jgi:hypothetical protein
VRNSKKLASLSLHLRLTSASTPSANANDIAPVDCGERGGAAQWMMDATLR